MATAYVKRFVLLAYLFSVGFSDDTTTAVTTTSTTSTPSTTSTTTTPSTTSTTSTPETEPQTTLENLADMITGIPMSVAQVCANGAQAMENMVGSFWHMFK